MTDTFIEENALADGSTLTVNPEIKYRRKRILSKQNAFGRPSKIAEFVNACRFLAGDTDKPFPLSLVHSNILSLIRNNHDVPQNYASVISNNLDIVLKAAALKPSEVKSKYFATNYITNNKSIDKNVAFTDTIKSYTKQMPSITIVKDNKINNKNTLKLKKENLEMTRASKSIELDEQTKNDFMQYLQYRIGKAKMPNAPSNVKHKFNCNVGAYIRNEKAHCNKDLRDIMDAHPQIIEEIINRRQNKKDATKKQATTTIYKEVKFPEDATITSSVPENTLCTNITIFNFMKTLKAIGLSEITFKF